MRPVLREDHWDLTSAIALNYCLSVANEIRTPVEILANSLTSPPSLPQTFATKENESEQVSHLGDFGAIWQLLGQPTQLQPTDVLPAPGGEHVDLLKSHENGPCQLSPKVVKWRDELEGADLADNDENYQPQVRLRSIRAEEDKLKRQQKRRQRAEALSNKRSLPSGSEGESGKEVQAPQRPDTKSVIHEFLHGTPRTPTSTGRLRSGKVFRNDATKDDGLWPVASPRSARQALQILKPQRESAFAIAAAKKAKLIAMLTETFIDERPYLSSISFIQPVGIDSSTPTEGIHIFVDASNIMIGFHDALKLSRGQSLNFRMRRQPLSFHNFSLILERGRPTVKRIVVGSDNFPAISEAKAIGYETNILDRVHKAKELTPRQKKFANNGTGTGTGSGSETTAAAIVQYAPEKWVEQAVDEILHLKMMESVVDASKPSTMVLATGDAAEAEYSGGFLKMVERALGKGWNVELACFKHNMSRAYGRKEFRQKWGERFRIIELDGFVEVLLGTDP